MLGAVGDGQLSLDDTLARWLPGVLPRLDESAITVRMQLDHTSGVPDADYWLLAMILERATGQSYTEQIEARLLRPLGLAHTVLPSNTTGLPRPYMHGYSLRPGKPPLDVSAFNSSWGSSSGGIVSTTGDLDRFAAALLGGRLLAPEELAAMKRGVRVPASPMGVSVDRSIRKVVEAAFCG